MSMFENDQYRWRETYFVFFDAAARPKLKAVEKLVDKLSGRFTITNTAEDETGTFESLTVVSPDDFAAMDICYLEGEEVLEQGIMLAEELESVGCQPDERETAKRILQCTGRFDVLHFEEITASRDGDDADEMLDPSALLEVLEALERLVGGLAIDPQGGTMV
jgi:hypothetical protein